MTYLIGIPLALFLAFVLFSFGLLDNPSQYATYTRATTVKWSMRRFNPMAPWQMGFIEPGHAILHKHHFRRTLFGGLEHLGSEKIAAVATHFDPQSLTGEWQAIVRDYVSGETETVPLATLAGSPQ